MSRCACVTCRGRYDYADFVESGDQCPRCGERAPHAVVFLDNPVVVIPAHLATSVRASVWGRPN